MAQRKTIKMFKFLIFGLLVLGFNTHGYADLTKEADDTTKVGDYSSQVSLLAPLADAGDAEAQYRLAVLYRAGRGVDRDLEVAADLLHRAAAQGHDLAQHSLGTIYLRGEGVPKDPAKAKFWFETAAEKEATLDAENLQANDTQVPVGTGGKGNVHPN